MRSGWTQTNATYLIVGVGRPFIYAFSAYGTEGVERALQILKAILFSSSAGT